MPHLRYAPSMSSKKPIKSGLQVHSYFGSLIFGIVQVIALLSYVVAYFPGGTQTLRLGGSLALRGASNLLPR